MLLNCGIGKDWRRQWHPTPVLLPGKSHGWRSLEGCSPWGHWGLDTTERLHLHSSLSCTGEGNGNPLQYSCLENPWDGGARWAAIYGVAQSRIRLKQLSSSSSNLNYRGKQSPNWFCNSRMTARTQVLSIFLLCQYKVCWLYIFMLAAS